MYTTRVRDVSVCTLAFSIPDIITKKGEDIIPDLGLFLDHFPDEKSPRLIVPDWIGDGPL